LITASVVFLLAGRMVAATDIGIVSALVACSFLVSLFYTVFNLPAWLADLSIFHQYGSPITDGPRWGASLAMIGLAVVVLAVGVLRFSRADVQRGQ
jgi:ABC-2 type transport system permease protein